MSNCSLTRATDGRIVRCGIISSCQSAATSEIVKRLWSRTHVRSAATSIATFTSTFRDATVILKSINHRHKVYEVQRSALPERPTARARLEDKSFTETVTVPVAVKCTTTTTSRDYNLQVQRCIVDSEASTAVYHGPRSDDHTELLRPVHSTHSCMDGTAYSSVLQLCTRIPV